MSKVVRLSDLTMELMNEYLKYIKEEGEKYGIEYSKVIKTDDQIIQAALYYTLKCKDHLL